MFDVTEQEAFYTFQALTMSSVSQRSTDVREWEGQNVSKNYGKDGHEVSQMKGWSNLIELIEVEDLTLIWKWIGTLPIPSLNYRNLFILKYWLMEAHVEDKKSICKSDITGFADG